MLILGLGLKTDFEVLGLGLGLATFSLGLGLGLATSGLDLGLAGPVLVLQDQDQGQDRSI